MGAIAMSAGDAPIFLVLPFSEAMSAPQMASATRKSWAVISKSTPDSTIAIACCTDGYPILLSISRARVAPLILVAKAKATLDVGDKKPSGKERRRRPLSEVTCYSCHAKGHYARDCKARPRSEGALITYGNSDGSDSDNETAYMTTDVNRSSERALISADEVLIDSRASVNVFNSQHLLRNIRKSQRPIVLNGVQSGASGVAIDMEGDFNELGAVFSSKGASANILSLAQLVDSGADVRYEAELDRFTLRPKTSDSLYIFCRKDIAGTQGRFYVCQLSTMVETAKISAADLHQLALWMRT
jgi:Zinc knuckle